MSAAKPESYEELDRYLNRLSASAWKAILHCYHIGSNRRVIRYLRRECEQDLGLWTDAELSAYIDERDLTNDFEPVQERW